MRTEDSTAPAMLQVSSNNLGNGHSVAVKSRTSSLKFEQNGRCALELLRRLMVQKLKGELVDHRANDIE